MMVYQVATGERFATPTINGETEIKFSAPYRNFSIENKSGAAIYVSVSGNTTPNADGVVEIKPNNSFPYIHNKPNIYSVFVSGVGEISVWASNNDTNPFQIKRKGGDGFYIGENLLINPDFKINQRGKTGTITHNSETASENYFVDRWYLKSGNVTINNDGSLTLNGTIIQILENAVGTNVTASVSAGTASYDNATKTFSITGDGDVIRWAKLEYGDDTTPFVAPDPTLEKIKCWRTCCLLQMSATRTFPTNNWWLLSEDTMQYNSHTHLSTVTFKRIAIWPGDIITDPDILGTISPTNIGRIVFHLPSGIIPDNQNSVEALEVTVLIDSEIYPEEV